MKPEACMRESASMTMEAGTASAAPCISRALPQVFPAAVPIAIQSRNAAGLNMNSGATLAENAFAHNSSSDSAAQEDTRNDIAVSGRSAARVIHKINKHQSNRTLSRNYISSSQRQCS
jgi:hypothetical protein